MTTIERGIELNVPAEIGYRVWSRFELFPNFMEGVESVRVTHPDHMHWRAKVFGVTEEWDAVITERIDGKRIAWKSEAGAANAGVVTFHRIDDRTSRLMLQMEFRPERFTEKVGDALGLLERRIEGDLERFKQFVEREGQRVARRRVETPAQPHATAAQAGQ